MSAPAATDVYKVEVAANVQYSNKVHKAENSYDNNLPNVPNYEALGMDESKENKRPNSPMSPNVDGKASDNANITNNGRPTSASFRSPTI